MNRDEERRIHIAIFAALITGALAQGIGMQSDTLRFPAGIAAIVIALLLHKWACR